MKIAIMQPYIFPYIGYFQLINAVDKFVLYDNIQFTKKGWINRNRVLVNGKDEYLTFSLKKGSDFLNVDQRELSEGFEAERVKLLRRIIESYRKAPEFDAVYPLVESIISNSDKNLFRYIYHSLRKLCEFLEIKTAFVVSSTIPIDHSLRSQDKVIAICKSLGATQYLNPIGGVELYSKEIFKQHNIELGFIKSGLLEYKQFSNTFVPWLSIIDVLMFNSVNDVQEYLHKRYLII